MASNFTHLTMKTNENGERELILGYTSLQEPKSNLNKIDDAVNKGDIDTILTQYNPDDCTKKNPRLSWVFNRAVILNHFDLVRAMHQKFGQKCITTYNCGNWDDVVGNAAFTILKWLHKNGAIFTCNAYTELAKRNPGSFGAGSGIRSAEDDEHVEIFMWLYKELGLVPTQESDQDTNTLCEQLMRVTPALNLIYQHFSTYLSINNNNVITDAIKYGEVEYVLWLQERGAKFTIEHLRGNIQNVNTEKLQILVEKCGVVLDEEVCLEAAQYCFVKINLWLVEQGVPHSPQKCLDAALLSKRWYSAEVVDFWRKRVEQM